VTFSANETWLTSGVPSGPKPIHSVVEQHWWEEAQRNPAKYEYHPSENGKGLQAPNRAHNFRTYFGPTGIQIQDRTARSPTLASLSLVAIGHGDMLEPVSAGEVDQTNARVEIRRPRVTEWYENSVEGLEQGFTIPAPMAGHGPLVLELAVEEAKASLHGQSIELFTEAGRRLRYGKLTV
jgi:hypothetical protein